MLFYESPFRNSIYSRGHTDRRLLASSYFFMLPCLFYPSIISIVFVLQLIYLTFHVSTITGQLQDMQVRSQLVSAQTDSKFLLPQDINYHIEGDAGYLSIHLSWNEPSMSPLFTQEVLGYEIQLRSVRLNIIDFDQTLPQHSCTPMIV